MSRQDAPPDSVTGEPPRVKDKVPSAAVVLASVAAVPP